jgi:hypothetical protein
MSDGQEKNAKSADPFEPFRTMRDAYLDAMAKTMVEAVNTEAYAQASGAMLEGSLSAAAPFRDALEKSMSQALQHLSLPSRQEVAALAERFTHVEMRLDDMDAKLERIEKTLMAAHPEPAKAKAAKPGAGRKSAPPPDAQGAASGERKRAARRFVRSRSARSAQK